MTVHTVDRAGLPVFVAPYAQLVWTVLSGFPDGTGRCLVAGCAVLDGFLMFLMSKYDITAFGLKYDDILGKPGPDTGKDTKGSACPMKCLH